MSVVQAHVAAEWQSRKVSPGLAVPKPGLLGPCTQALRVEPGP